MSIRHRGFTLLEILIAMAIFTLIGLASTSVLTNVLDADAISSERFERLQQLQRAMLVMERDIQQAVPRPARIQGEANGNVLQGTKYLLESESDGLALVRAGRANPQWLLGRSTLQAVGYRLQNGELQRLYGNFVDNPVGIEPKIKVLLANVNDFKVEFLAPERNASRTSSNNQQKWEESYLGTVLPRALAIEIDSQDFGVIRREFYLGEPNA